MWGGEGGSPALGPPARLPHVFFCSAADGEGEEPGPVGNFIKNTSRTGAETGREKVALVICLLLLLSLFVSRFFWSFFLTNQKLFSGPMLCMQRFEEYEETSRIKA